MTIWGSFTTSMMAMNTHSHAMDQIGTNIANMNTTSYKEVETHYQTILSGSKAATDFFSVKPVDIRRVMEQGGITSSVNAYDLAINGQGFFVANTAADGSGDTYYTRDGSFGTKAYDLGTDTDGNGQNDQASLLVTRQGQYLMGWAANGTGGFGSTLGPVQVNSNAVAPGKATTKIDLSGNVPNNNGSAATYNSSIAVVSANAGGSVASKNNITLNWKKSIGEDNTWTLSLGTSNNDNIATATLSPSTVTFDNNGRVSSADADSYKIDITWNDGSEPSSITLDLSAMSQYASTDGFTVGTMDSDGYLTGTLQKTAFNEFGVLSAYYSNGTVQDLYKLPLATFASPDNLTAYSGNIYRPNDFSGDPTLVSINSRRDVATFVPSALENSNVNLEDQFSRMIVTQKAYTMASTAFRTADEMTQEVRDMKR